MARAKYAVYGEMLVSYLEMSRYSREQAEKALDAVDGKVWEAIRYAGDPAKYDWDVPKLPKRALRRWFMALVGRGHGQSR